jgi:hypothetical protein
MGDIKRDTVSKRVPTIHSRPAKKLAKRATFIARAGDRRLKILKINEELAKLNSDVALTEFPIFSGCF